MAVDCPAASLILAGMVADRALLVRLTVWPALGAGPVKVIVPVDELPPARVAGFRVIDSSSMGLTANVAVAKVY